MNYNIVNIICNTEINQQLDLNSINLECNNTEYVPEVYFALIYRLEKPKVSILVNKSGKIIFTGAKSVEDIEKARDILFDDLFRMGYNPKKNILNYQNLVILINTQRKINLNNLIFKHKNNMNFKYNHKTFPGVHYKSVNPKFTGVIFGSGKIILTGIKDVENIQIICSIMEQIIEDK